MMEGWVDSDFGIASTFPDWVGSGDPGTPEFENTGAGAGAFAVLVFETGASRLLAGLASFAAALLDLRLTVVDEGSLVARGFLVFVTPSFASAVATVEDLAGFPSIFNFDSLVLRGFFTVNPILAFAASAIFSPP